MADKGIAMLCEIVGTWKWDTRQNRISLDAALAPYFSVSEAQAVAGITLEQCLEVIHPDDREDVRSASTVAHLSAGGYYQDYRVVSPILGVRRLLDIGKRSLENPLGYFGMIIDASQNEAHRSLEFHIAEAQKINDRFGNAAAGYLLEAVMHSLKTIKSHH